MTAHSDARMRLVAWKRRRKGALRGFADVELPIGLLLHDCPVLETNGRRWASLPAKAQIEDGRQRLDANGKLAYAPVMAWQDKRLRDAFSERLVALVVAEDPGAFADDDGVGR